MRILEVEGDLLKVDVEVICHQVNCLGKMGAGLALQVRQAYPEVFKMYSNYCYDTDYDKDIMMGKVFWVEIGEGKLIANIFGQYGIRKGNKDKSIYTSYSALKVALEGISKACKEYNIKSIAFPVGMGCDRGGGDWDVVREIITRGLKSNDIDVYLVRYKKV